MKNSVRLLTRVSGPTGHFLDRRSSTILARAQLRPSLNPLAGPIPHRQQPKINRPSRRKSSFQTTSGSICHDIQPSILQSETPPRDLVCDRCWNDLFNTESFENCCTSKSPQVGLSHRHVEATATVSEIRAASCSWCAYLREFVSNSWEPDDRVTINLGPSEFKSSTPTGSNTFWLGIDCTSPTGKWRGGYSLFLHACTPADDPAARYVTARPVRTDVDSEPAKGQIRDWFENCKAHDCCSSLPRDSPLPTRVIEVDPPGQDRPRILESKGMNGVYAILSYSRSQEDFPMLTTSSYGKFTTGLDINALPPTIRHAIETARTLSIPYLWIDALCVLQDANEEKATHLSQMSEIFGSSALTIVAAAAENVYQGFIYPRVHNEHLHTIPVRLGPDSFGTMSINELDAATYEDLSEPIFKSPGAVQEHVMSNRILTYTTNTMMWRCNHGAQNFGDSLYFPHFLGNGYSENTEKYSLNMYTLPLSEDEACTNKHKALSSWLRLVTASSFATTASDSDKLNSLAGVASRSSFAHALGPGYYAGMWEYNLARQLTWSTSSWHRTLAEDDTFTFHRPKTYRAPSWSWASVEGGMIEFDFCYDEEDEELPKIICDILDCSTKPALPHLNPFGEILSAELKLQGPTRLAWFNPTTSNVLILPGHVTSALTTLNTQNPVTTYEEAFKTHTEEFMATHPDEDIAEDPELFDGTDYRNVKGTCDETDFEGPVLVLCVGITHSNQWIGGVSGLLLVRDTQSEGSGNFRRIGVFERGKAVDFEPESNTELCIV